jgi:hypothetical protein
MACFARSFAWAKAAFARSPAPSSVNGGGARRARGLELSREAPRGDATT